MCVWFEFWCVQRTRTVECNEPATARIEITKARKKASIPRDIIQIYLFALLHIYLEGR